MDVPLQLIIFGVLSLIYMAVLRRRGLEWRQAFERVGWRGCRPAYFLWGLGVAALAGVLGWLAFMFIPREVLQDPNVNTSAYAGWTRGVDTFLMVLIREAIYVALGEEIFFRGMLGGWLTRRLGFAIGNAVQSLLFLLPHLLLLLVSLSLWPIVLVQWLMGWLLGWLRYRSHSILPGWLAHSLANALGALAAMA